MTAEMLMPERTVREQLASLARELHDLVNRLQEPLPQMSREAWAKALADRCHALADRAAQARAALAGRQKSLAESLDRMTVALRSYSAELANGPVAAKVESAQAALAKSYEDLLHQLRRGRAAVGAIRMPHLKPVRLGRSAFHVFCGVLAATLYETILDRTQALTVLGSLVGVFGSLEITRRFSTRWNDFLVDKAFGFMSRPWERHRTNSATLYLIALTIMTALMSRHAVAVGVLVLAIGDPAAAFIGKRYGRAKVIGNKSWAGLGGFIGAAALSVGVLLRIAVPELEWTTTLAVAALAATVGGLVEVICQDLEDNFAIPILAAAAATIWF